MSRVSWHKPVRYSHDLDSSRNDQEPVEDPQKAVLVDSRTLKEDLVTFDYALLHFTAQTASLCIEMESTPSNLSTFAAYIREGRAYSQGFPRVTAQVSLLSKRKLAIIWVPIHVFRDSTRQFKEFALLSEYTGEIYHEIVDKGNGRVEKSDPVRDLGHEHHNTRMNLYDHGHGNLQKAEAEDEEVEGHVEEDCDLRRLGRPQSHKENCLHKSALNVMLIEWVKTRHRKNFAIRVAVGRIKPSAWEEVSVVRKTIVLG